MRPDPSVLTVMTPFPVQATADTSIADAQAMMTDHGIRHLPVERDGEVIGVVSLGDLHLASQLLDQPTLPLERLCVRPPLIVDSHTTLKQAVLAMSERGLDATLVLRQGRLAGILTLSDITAVLLTIMPGPAPVAPSGPDDIA